MFSAAPRSGIIPEHWPSRAPHSPAPIPVGAGARSLRVCDDLLILGHKMPRTARDGNALTVKIDHEDRSLIRDAHALVTDELSWNRAEAREWVVPRDDDTALAKR